jgi:2'-hydroxyisoflavone reductase
VAPDPLRILILGGTGWLGPNQVRAALSRGHEVTLFNRGQRNPGMFPELETLIGDRDDDLEALRGREWDVAIDNSATIPRWVRQSTEVLGDAVGAYVFVSSVGVYLPYLTAPLAEDGPVGTIEDSTTEQVNGATYGALKALSEQVARKALPRHVSGGPARLHRRPG